MQGLRELLTADGITRCPGRICCPSPASFPDFFQQRSRTRDGIPEVPWPWERIFREREVTDQGLLLRRAGREGEDERELWFQPQGAEVVPKEMPALGISCSHMAVSPPGAQAGRGLSLQPGFPLSFQAQLPLPFESPENRFPLIEQVINDSLCFPQPSLILAGKHHPPTAPRSFSKNNPMNGFAFA